MKTLIMVLSVLLFAGNSVIAQTHQSSKHKKHVTVSKKYTCPMHPDVVRSKPGKCPKCGMKLVAMKKK